MATAVKHDWIYTGLASAIPNIEPDSAKVRTKITLPGSSDGPDLPPCKIYRPPSPDSDATSCTELSLSESQTSIGLEPQVMVFRYRNKLHAIDHICPHRHYPLSRGSLTDIEDFGIVLSTAITCPGHGWAFDVNTGQCSRGGGYRLGIWDVEVRRTEDGEEGVWVRMKAGR